MRCTKGGIVILGGRNLISSIVRLLLIELFCNIGRQREHFYWSYYSIDGFLFVTTCNLWTRGKPPSVNPMLFRDCTTRFFAQGEERLVGEVNL